MAVFVAHEKTEAIGFVDGQARSGWEEGFDLLNANWGIGVDAKADAMLMDDPDNRDDYRQAIEPGENRTNRRESFGWNRGFRRRLEDWERMNAAG
jgi:hypothetical protein